MKRFALGALAALSVGAFTIGVKAQGDEGVAFQLDNASGRTVTSFALETATGAEETLAVGVRSGEAVSLLVEDTDGDCRYDLVVDYADGGVERRSGVNLCGLPGGVLVLD